MNPSRRRLRELLRTVAATEPAEIDCEELLARIGAFLDVLERGSVPPPELRAVMQHLEVCPECHEELDALLELHGGQTKIDE